jgi:hypothetical protein
MLQDHRRTVTPDTSPLAPPLTAAAVVGRQVLKRFLYSQMALRQGLMIALGREQPLVRFTVEADPPSVYWVFRLRPDELDGLAGRLGLPAHLESTPIRCLADDEPAHLLTLNVYRVSGLANGIRAEWSMYVGDADGTPRYLVVDARSSQMSMDPVGIITPATPVSHRRAGDALHTAVGEGDRSFECELALSGHDSDERVRPAPEWVTANDYIYWANGICDRTFYDAGLADPNQYRLPASAATIVDRSRWASLIEPQPAHVLVFRDAIQFVVSPWENVDRLGI